MDVAYDDWSVWIMACFSCCISLSLVLYYIICLPLHIQTRALAQMVGIRFGKRWNLGSIPRSPHIFHIFFLNVFLCSIPSKAYHASSNASLPRAHELQSEGYQRTSTMYLSQWMNTQTGKSTKALYPVGLNFSIYLQKGPETPPGLHSSILFSFSILILLIILIVFL